MELENKANYDAIAEHWQSARAQLPALDKLMFVDFIERLPPKAKVLDLGCGHGVPIAKLLLESGFEVTGVDKSQALLEQARVVLPELTLVESDITTVEFNQTFDACVFWDVIFHLPRPYHKALLSKVYDSLSHGGYLIVSSGGSEESIPAFTDFMFGVEFYYDAHPVGEFKALCEEIGFALVRFEYVNKPDGARDKGRIGLILQK